MTGYTEEEFRSLTYWDITPVDYKDMEAKQLESLHTVGRYGPYEKEYIRKDGTRFPVLLSGVRIQDPSGTDLNPFRHSGCSRTQSKRPGDAGEPGRSEPAPSRGSYRKLASGHSAQRVALVR